MTRPHIEFIQTQALSWSTGADGVAIKILNADPESEARTVLTRLPPGWNVTPGMEAAKASEFFVLDGEIEIDGESFSRHAYGFLPADHDWRVKRSEGGATLLVFDYAVGDPDSASGDPIAVDTAHIPWDDSLYDPALIHLRLARKVLRMGDNNSGRTYLLTGLPHGRPDVPDLQQETHPHAEEMFMISGEMSAPEGMMRTGAYFYRPPGIIHGPHVSDLGFLMLMRNPGSNRVITDWSIERRPLPLNAPYQPILPPGSPEALRQPWPDPVTY